MKNIFLSAICCIALSTACFAQDMIITRDNQKIFIKVIDENKEIVKYKLYDQQDGPEHTISTSKLSSLNFEDGRVINYSESPKTQPEIFGKTTTGQTTTGQITPEPVVELLPLADRLTADGCKVFKQGRELTKEEVRGLMMNMDAIRLYNKGINQNKNGNILLAAGGGMIAVGFLFVANQPITEVRTDKWGYTYEYIDYPYDGIIGVCMATGSVMAITGGILKFVTSKKFVKQSVDSYNRSGGKASMTLNFGITGNGVGLALVF